MPLKDVCNIKFFPTFDVIQVVQKVAFKVFYHFP